ncbi:hypothetical protein MKX08_004669 [Trichoderma sp. CBMAI-0020]|nr:hypothetical protein MKX08_004669 [Trichoderma sp. CBMAI-0020]
MAGVSVSQNSFDDLTAELSDLSLQQEEQGSSVYASNPQEDEDGLLPPHLIRETGDPLEVLAICPRDREVNYSLNWYYLPDAFEDTADYLICSRCHADHIKGTSLEVQFKQIEWPDGDIAVCRFWLPRVKDVLWPEAIRTNNIKPCPGQKLTEDVEDRTVYGLVDGEIESFAACEACYEDYIFGTGFEPHFGTYSELAPRWSCDLCMPYISGSVAPMAKHNNWRGFISGASRRFQLPACTGEQIRSDVIEWYLLKDYKLDNFHVCETCYLDKLALTPFKRDFQLFSGDLDPELWCCGLADQNISTAVALEAAIVVRKDLEVFVEAGQTICSLVPCTADGIVHGNWWTLEGCDDQFNICEACFAGFCQTRGLDDFFQLSKRDSSNAYVCEFCVASPRFAQYITKFAEMLDRGVFAYFSDFVMTFAGVPACPKIKGYGKSRWWGYPEARFCQECYLDFVAHTPLADSLSLNGKYIEETTLCHIWSPRMRSIWLEVCEAGEPGSEESDAALQEFKAFCVQRLQIYHATISEIEVIRAMQNIKKQSAFNHSLLSIQYQGMDGLATMFGKTDGHRYGSSSLGWFDTSYGAQSKQHWNSFMSDLSASNQPDDWVRMAKLEALWKRVE